MVMLKSWASAFLLIFSVCVALAGWAAAADIGLPYPGGPWMVAAGTLASVCLGAALVLRYMGPGSLRVNWSQVLFWTLLSLALTNFALLAVAICIHAYLTFRM